MEIESIITHPGGAHKDDLLACAVLLAENPVAIERRDPSAADLENPKIAVVDIGGEHVLERNNFDHHQLPADHVPTCALSLVLQKFGLYEDAQSFCGWLETSEWLDCRGPNDTASWLGIEREVLGKLNSPVDITLLRRFAGQVLHAPGEPIWEVLRMIGEDLVQFLRNLRERLTYVAKHVELWEVPSNGAKVQVLFMPRLEQLDGEPSAGLGQYIIDNGLEDSVSAMVYPDRRGNGYGMRRFNDSQLFDFTQLADAEDVHFTHARGFIAKTDANDPERLKALLQRALRA